MAVIGVNRQELVNYASTTEENCRTIIEELDAMITDCANVPYWGGNAEKFKTDATTAAVTMGEEITRGTKTFIGAVNGQTSAISKSLGGVDMSIDVAVRKPTMPSIPKSNADESGADTSALSTLQDQINTHSTNINTAATAIDTSLRTQTPNWVGNSKETAVGASGKFLTTVLSSVEKAKTTITGFINDQTTAVTAADAT
jgi:hypothetical protein